jgi:hypothetical protein
MSNSQFWHRRLHHLSNKTLYFPSNNVSELCNSNSKPCLVCPLATQIPADVIRFKLISHIFYLINFVNYGLSAYRVYMVTLIVRDDRVTLFVAPIGY